MILPTLTSDGRNPSQTLTQNLNRATSALNAGRPTSEKVPNERWDATQEGGQYFKKKKKDMRRRERARAFWDKLTKARKTPFNCGRCGKPNNNGKRQCPKCLAYQARYRKRKLLEKGIEGRGIKATGNIQLMRRVASLELAVARLQGEMGQRRNAYRYVQRREKVLKATQSRPKGQPWFEDMPCMSYQELATMNHAYQRS